jgi:hypothetical protein
MCGPLAVVTLGKVAVFFVLADGGLELDRGRCVVVDHSKSAAVLRRREMACRPS